MKSIRIMLVVATAMSIVGACGPKSRYRAKDIVDTTISTMGAPKGKVTVVPEEMVTGLKNPVEPQTQEGKDLLEKTEHIAIAKSKDGEKFNINLFISEKADTGVSSRLIEVEGKLGELKVTKVSRVVGSELKVIPNAELELEIKCLDDECKDMTLNIGGAKGFEATARVVDDKKKTSKVAGSDEINEKVKDLLGSEIGIQRSTVRVYSKKEKANVNFHTLTLVGTDNQKGPIVLTLKSNEGSQKPEILYGKSRGIESVDYLGVDAKTFQINLKGKDGVLGHFKFEAIVATPPPPTSACLPVNEDLAMKVTCYKQIKEDGSRELESFVLKYELKNLALPQTVNLTRKDGTAVPDVEMNDNSKILSSFKTPGSDELTFEIKSTPNTKGTISISDECCVESMKTSGQPGEGLPD